LASISSSPPHLKEEPKSTVIRKEIEKGRRTKKQKREYIKVADPQQQQKQHDSSQSNSHQSLLSLSLNSHKEKRAQLLKSDIQLRELYNELVIPGIISEEDFWKAREVFIYSFKRH
jgi:hypothetical protein